MPVSLTEEGYCAENALAERMNGILKQEYFLNHEFRTVAQARKPSKEQRPHLFAERDAHN